MNWLKWQIETRCCCCSCCWTNVDWKLPDNFVLLFFSTSVSLTRIWNINFSTVWWKECKCNFFTPVSRELIYRLRKIWMFLLLASHVNLGLFEWFGKTTFNRELKFLWLCEMNCALAQLRMTCEVVTPFDFFFCYLAISRCFKNLLF